MHKCLDALMYLVTYVYRDLRSVFLARANLRDFLEQSMY